MYFVCFSAEPPRTAKRNEDEEAREKAPRKLHWGLRWRSDSSFEIEGECAREELVIKLPRDPTEEQIPAARSPQKTPKKDMLCTHEGCSVRFSNFRAQKLHHVEQHQEMVPGIKVKECPVCKKLLAYESRLNEHLVTHTKERKATCSFCGMTFSRPSARNAHEKTQHGKFWYICWICRNQYMSSKYLKRHHKNKHHGPCYACTQCHHMFYSNSSKMSHKCETEQEKQLKAAKEEARLQALQKKIDKAIKEK